MLCVSAEDALAAAAAAAAASDKMHSVTLGGSIQKALRRMTSGGGRRSAGSERRESGDASGLASCYWGDSSIGRDKREGGRIGSMQRYRSQLEQEVKKLQMQLQDEIDLHLALAGAITHDAALILNSSIKLPDKTQNLMISIASLEIAVSKLEKDLNHLHYELCYIRKERLLAENYPGCLLPTSSGCEPSTICTWEADVSTSGHLRLEDSQSTRSMQEDSSAQLEDQLSDEKHSEYRDLVYLDMLLERHQDVPLTRLLGVRDDKMQEVCSMEKRSKEDDKIDALQFRESNLMENSMSGNLRNNPNKLSEEMVRCMRDIFLHLSASSQITPKAPFDSSSSSAEHMSDSTLTSSSDSSTITSLLHSPSVDLNHDDATMDGIRNFDPYNANEKETRRDIGCYCSIAEVSWMYVGNEQLEYASRALKKFRWLVEQLSEVDPTCMNYDERLAFWINMYNALIMHAYLAYGVPENDFKLFSLMQQACYTVGELSISAAEIEFVILKMKVPVHRPQLSLMLALHKFKTSEKHKKYSIDGIEPLVLFALSCGMFSSPAVRIFTAENVQHELQESMRDYIRASVGINDKGELIVPKLLQSYAKGIVEDSLFAD
ncbi:hypothetical protein QOZ80_6AG0549100 [Eleusine coracana subsp. coracana]|nr:hypothetical protein QOZ80_6AG0549100 [Eleusine coracana subsp. coracana]